MAAKAAVKRPTRKLHVRKGDTVEVIRGDDAGKRGKVLQVFPAKGRIVVEGVNIQKRHTRPTRTNPQGGVIEKPGPIDSSKVMLVCPGCDKPSRYRRQRSGDGELVRVCVRCGKMID
ncbi:50S ribosomal protein L24 [Geochorda subterranea]|uniref:Large ribosomal subunit protein uL24 n=1 Tax=Geochorda subterranea TaxID=3109564 RepID=A0ABZ1BMY7_9FIRM|nr:50S ribosomal protein L24 [Limnochorda sp. LNt]WRP14147.1 50S ribosomal protein L24 [Limnochorda sp. LNt]